MSNIDDLAARQGKDAPEDRIERTGDLVELAKLLGLERIEGVQVYGRGGRAYVRIALSGGKDVVFETWGSCATPSRLTQELAMQAGVTPPLKASTIARIAKLIHDLAAHRQEVEIETRAWELAAEYLRGAVIGEVDMSDQASRWKAFAALERGSQGNVVLLDATGERYIRVRWFHEYLRQWTCPGEPAAMVAALTRLGWSKPGREGRVKATQPGFGRALIWAFYVVPEGWERDEGQVTK
jgi:hypothetical protein